MFSLSARSEEALSLIFTGRRVEFHSLLDTGIHFQYSLNLVGLYTVNQKAKHFPCNLTDIELAITRKQGNASWKFL